MEHSLSLQNVLETRSFSSGTLVECALPAVGWLALALWQYGPYLRSRSAQISCVGIGVLSIAVAGPSAATMLVGNTEFVRMPAWARLAQPESWGNFMTNMARILPPWPADQFTTGLCVGAAVGFGVGGVLMTMYNSRSNCETEQRPSADRQEVERLKRQVAELSLQIKGLNGLQASSRCTSQAGSRCQSRGSSPCRNGSPCRNRLGSSDVRGDIKSPAMTPHQSPTKSPRKSCGRFSLDSTTEGSLRTSVEDGDLWASPLPDQAIDEDFPLMSGQMTPTLSGQMTPPTGWNTDHFEMDQDDEAEDRRKSRRFSFEALFSDDRSWIMQSTNTQS